MSRGQISLHELTGLQVDISGQRAKAPGRQGKNAASKRDIKGNVINPRPYRRRHRLKSVERSPSRDEQPGEVATSSLTEPTRAVSSSPGLRSGRNGKQRPKRRGEEYFPGVLPYLNPPKRPRVGTSSDSEGDNEMPSSDLLKAIHHFAGVYYDERGMLTASSNRFAKELRENQDQSRPVDEQADSDSSKEVAVDVQAQDTKLGHSKIKDMYRAFDGSALLFIGMLVHEHVVSRINRPEVSVDEWTQRVQADKERVERMRKHRSRWKKVKQEDDVNVDEADDRSSSSDEEALANILVGDKDDIESV